jgi:ribosomal protein S5
MMHGQTQIKFSFVSKIFSSGRGMSFYISVVIPQEESYVSRGRCFNGDRKQVQIF